MQIEKERVKKSTNCEDYESLVGQGLSPLSNPTYNFT